MKIMLDNSPNQLKAKEEKFCTRFWQLQTPISRRQIIRPYGLDNGCFATFDEKTWWKQVGAAGENRPKFICLPDIVGDARRTLDLFQHFTKRLDGLPKALVLQDGIGHFAIPWDDIDAVFVGGSDAFKTAPEALNACKAAKIMGKWVHVGRVNTASRVRNWLGLADSLDGSGISRFDHMLGDVLSMIRDEHPQMAMIV